MVYLCYFAAIAGLFAVVTALYRLLSKGLSRSAKGQQLTRFGVGAVLAVLPLAIAGEVVWTRALTLIAVVSVLSMITFPLLDRVANSQAKAEIDNRMDFAFGLYLFGFLSALYLALNSLLPAWANVTNTLLAALELPMMVLLLGQVIYYMVYRTSIDHDGLKLVLDTNVNEVLEFVRSFPVWATIPGLLALIALLILWFWWSLTGERIAAPDLNWMQRTAEVACVGVLGSLLFKGAHSAFRRSGLPKLYFDNRDYTRQCASYAASCRERMKNLTATSDRVGEGLPTAPGEKGRTFVLVIGESASRDYMEAFAPSEANAGTTPWLASLTDGSAVLLPNAYSCHFQTVPTLERALTAMNQYNDLRFTDSVSIVDMAHKLGMKVYWFSNQGHIGQNDTPITLVAETADTARWTSQTLNNQPYDGELLKFLQEVDPEDDKLVVFHLMGSHFTYSNRYPASEEHFATRGGNDYEAAYRNSLRYTDRLLADIFAYTSRHLNLQAMVYCSDHADLPDRRRSPSFNGFGQVRIPLAVVMTPAYLRTNADIAEALRANSRRPFSNDLLFDLMCGLWHVDSPAAPRRFSIAAPDYTLTPESTKVLLGARTVADDPGFLP